MNNDRTQLRRFPVSIPVTKCIRHKHMACTRRAHFWEIVGTALAGLEDLPFQLPAELADGLGLESGLETSYLASFAPSSNCFEEFGSPAPGLRKEAGFRLQTAVSFTRNDMLSSVRSFR
jgi:hypothetical protein